MTPDPAPPAGDGPARSRFRSPVPGRVLRPLLILVGVVTLRALVLAPEQVVGPSMGRTLRDGDVVMTVRPWLADRVDRLDRGDLVALQDPQSAGSIVKRVVGLPGDVVEIQDAVLTVGGRPRAEPYADLSGIDGVYYGPVTVPPRSLLVLGDDRGRSVDSRDFGPVPVGSLTGRVALRVWPWWR